MSLSPKTKMTLQQYLHAHHLQKKIEYRNKSKSKGKQNDFELHQKSSLNSIHTVLDNWSYEFKLEFHEFLSKDQPKQKVLFYLITNLDKLILRIKEEIRNMYKQVQMHYNVKHINDRNPKNVQYFREQHDIADLQVKKTRLAQMMKQKIKDSKKKDYLLEAIFHTTKKLSQKESDHLPGQNAIEEDNQPVDFISAMLGLSVKQSHRVAVPIEQQIQQKQQKIPQSASQQPERVNNLIGALISPPNIDKPSNTKGRKSQSRPKRK